MTSHIPAFTRESEAQRSAGEYKVKPIKQKVRELLDYPYSVRIPKGVFVEQWVGISTDEFHRAKDADVKHMRNRHPLLDLSWSRSDCVRYLTSLGLSDTPKSSCSGCPFHGNAQWRHIRDTSLSEWADVVEFDAAIRQGNARANAAVSRLLGEAFLHRSRVPLSQAPIDHVTAAERAALRVEADETDELENGVADSCSPWACCGEADAPAQNDFRLAT